MNQHFERNYPRYLAGEMSVEERIRFEAEVLSESGLSEEMYADQELAQRIRPRARRSQITDLWQWAVPLAAAIAMFMVGRAVDLPSPHQPSPTVMRSEGSPLVLHGSLEGRFIWGRVPGASGYRCELLDSQGIVQRTVVTSDTFALVQDPAPRIRTWRVTALDELGMVISRSPIAAVESFD